VLLTLSAAFSLHAQSTLTPTLTRDSKIVRRWLLPGDPHGLALGADGTLYVGLAQPQAVVAIDPTRGTVKRKVILDSAEIAATKELVALRTNAAGTRLFVANGSDESATILALPELGVVREITIEGEPIRDALPDPKGRYLFLLGHRVHVYDANGTSELRALGFDDPTAMAMNSDGSTLAVFGNEKVALYDTKTFEEIARDRLATGKRVEVAFFAAGDRVLLALSPEALYEIPLGKGLINSERICLPNGSGPQIAALAAPQLLLFAEQRCTSSRVFSASDRLVAPASLYGVNAYAVAYDRRANFLYTTERAGYLTIYRVPHAAVAH
jgi:hypothetical protein